MNPPEKEHCVFCDRDVDMFYISYKIKESEGEYMQTKHEIELRQCGFCKMIQPEED